MNTHDIDIELPAEFRSGNDIPVTQATIKRERMEEILINAIEADRKRRGEPVGYFYPWELERSLKAYPNGFPGAVAVFAAPQPAEPVSTHYVHRGEESLPCYCAGKQDHPIGHEVTKPVKVPSDSEIMWEWANTPNTGDMRVDLSVFARALLDRYGQQAQPIDPANDNPTPEEEEAWQQMEKTND